MTCHLEGGIEIAGDCQLEFGHRTSLVFKPFESNLATLLVRPRKSHPNASRGHLIIKKAFGHIAESQHVAMKTIDLDLRDPSEITSLPDLKAEDDDDQDVVQVKSSDYEDVVPKPAENVIKVKEFNKDDNEDLVFLPAETAKNGHRQTSV